MHPDARKRLAGIAFRLGQLVLVVRELEVESPTVDVDGVAEQRLTHDAALDVPPRPALAPRAVVLHLGRLVRLRALPEGEVAGVALLVADLDARARFELLGVAVTQLAIIIIAADIEIDIAPGGVGVALRNQALHHGDHAGNMIGGAGGTR